MEEITVFIALAAGLLSFFTPCVLPLVPVYLASLSGSEIFNSEVKRVRFPLFFHSLSFVVGFSLVFTLLGAGAGLIGFTFGAYYDVIRQIAGSLLVVFGLVLLLALKVPWLNFERRLTPSLGRTSGYLRSFLTGGVFSLAYTPCLSPILGGILALAIGSDTALRGAYLLGVYSLGLGLPFLAMGVAFDFLSPLLKRVQRYSVAMYIVSGVLLIAVGILILTNKLVLLQG
jgi:cytochrome c-type biogenesis protein